MQFHHDACEPLVRSPVPDCIALEESLVRAGIRSGSGRLLVAGLARWKHGELSCYCKAPSCRAACAVHYVLSLVDGMLYVSPPAALYSGPHGHTVNPPHCRAVTPEALEGPTLLCLDRDRW